MIIPAMLLSGLTDREPGYNYRVKAKMVGPLYKRTIIQGLQVIRWI
jgi:hypothetical protein